MHPKLQMFTDILQSLVAWKPLKEISVDFEPRQCSTNGPYWTLMFGIVTHSIDSMHFKEWQQCFLFPDDNVVSVEATEPNKDQN